MLGEAIIVLSNGWRQGGAAPSPRGAHQEHEAVDGLARTRFHAWDSGRDADPFNALIAPAGIRGTLPRNYNEVFRRPKHDIFACFSEVMPVSNSACDFRLFSREPIRSSRHKLMPPLITWSLGVYGNI